MANDVSIRFSVDGESQFKSAVSSIDSQIKNLNSEMKLAVSGMAGMDDAEAASAQKMDILGRTSDALKQKIDVLSKQYDSQSATLRDLGVALDATIEQYGEGSAEAIKAEAAYNRQAKAVNDLGTKLNKTKTDLNNTETAMKKVKDGTEDTAKSMDEAGNSASIFGSVLSAELVSSAIIGGVKQLASAMKEVAIGTAQLADDILTQSKVTGLSTDALQEYDYMSKLVDVDTQTITGSLTKLTRNMMSAKDGTGAAAEAFKQLGVDVIDGTGQLRSNQVVFDEVLAALADIPNQTEADALAMQIFGKSAQELNPLIQTSTEQLNAMREEAHQVGYVMGEEMLENGVAASDAFDRMNNAVQGLKNEIGAALAPALTDLFTTITNVITSVKDFASENDALIPIIEGVTTAVVAFVVAINFSTIVEAVTTALAAMQGAVLAVNAALAANPIVLVVSLIAGLIVALVEAYRHCEAFREKVNAAFKAVKDGVLDAIEKVKGAVEYLKGVPDKAFKWGRDLIDNFLKGLKQKAKDLKDGVASIATTIKDYLGFSEPKEGPLSNFHTYAPDMIDLFTEGIYQNLGQVQRASEAMANVVANAKTDTPSASVSAVNAMGSALNTVAAAAGSQPIELSLNIDGRQFAKATYSALQNEGARRGGSLVTI